MAQNQSIIAQIEALDKIVKVIILLFAGGLVSPVYRIIRYTETKNTTTLIVGILALVTGSFFGILCLIDIINEITDNKLTVFVD